MADKSEKKPAEQQEAPPKRGRRRIVLVGLIVGIMAAEAAVVVVLVKSFSRAAPEAAHASAAALDPKEGKKPPAEIEVKIGEFRTQNLRGQSPQTVDFCVFVTVKEPDKAKAEELIAAKAAKIKDCFSRVVRSMEPERFKETDLTTLRSQLRHELTQVAGEELPIGEVLFTAFSATGDE